MTVEAGTPSELAGLLVVNPEEGNERPNPGNDQDPPAPAGDEDASVDWNANDGSDNAAEDAATETGDEQTGDDSEANADGGEQPDAESYEVTIGGKTERVTLKEALAGYQRQADYTRKTQEIATAHQALVQETEAARANRSSYKQVLDALEAKIGPANQEPNAEQWEALKAQDPEKYAVEWADYQRRGEQRNAINAERQRVATEEAGEQRKLLQTFVNGERVKLIEAMPQWKGKDGKVDANKMASEVKEVREYAAKTLGYTEAELNQAYDHRMIVLARKAMLHDRAEAARKAAKAKLAGAPDIPAPGARVPRQSGRDASKAEAQKKFDKSGKIDDAVGLLLS